MPNSTFTSRAAAAKKGSKKAVESEDTTKAVDSESAEDKSVTSPESKRARKK